MPHKRQIYSRIQSHQGLVGADVARGLLPADMLLAGLEGQHESTPSLRI